MLKRLIILSGKLCKIASTSRHKVQQMWQAERMTKNVLKELGRCHTTSRSHVEATYLDISLCSTTFCLRGLSGTLKTDARDRAWDPPTDGSPIEKVFNNPLNTIKQTPLDSLGNYQTYSTFRTCEKMWKPIKTIHQPRRKKKPTETQSKLEIETEDFHLGAAVADLGAEWPRKEAGGGFRWI